MASRNKPYDSFGPFILFKNLETDALGDLWRAGRIENGHLGDIVALRRISGGQRETVAANVAAIGQVLPRITGASFVREQQAGVIDGVPFLAWEYAGGRSLRHVMNRARGGKDVQPNPLPIDQAIVIAERIALSLATMADLRETSGARLSHGALIPQFIWISDDGEIRVAGQLLGSAILASLADARVAADIARYFAPEHRVPGAHKNADVYSMGAILYLLVTGQEPPDAATASAFGAAVRAAKTPSGGAIPDDIRVILDKSFNLDPAMRYASMGDMKQAISAVAHGGRYSATSFNLAFYLSNLLKQEMENEAADREAEAKVAVAPYLEAPKAEAPVVATPPPPASARVAPAAAPATPAAPASRAAAAPVTPPPQAKSKAPLAIAVVVVLALAGGGAYMMLGRTQSQPPAKQTVAAQAIPVRPAEPPRVISEPIAVTPNPQAPATTTAPAGTAEDQQKAFEDAVRKKMQDELMKLQADYMAELKKQQSKNAPVPVTPPAAAPVQAAAPSSNLSPEERATLSAAQLDQQRREARTEAAPATATIAPVQQATQQVAPAPAVVAPAVAAAPTVREGDVVDAASLDVLPRITRPVRPTYPPLAARQKIAATVFLTVLVSESGEVLDVKVLRGEPRFGLNDAAVRAMRATRFSAPMKDGKRVRTWFPQSIEFKAN